MTAYESDPGAPVRGHAVVKLELRDGWITMTHLDGVLLFTRPAHDDDDWRSIIRFIRKKEATIAMEREAKTYNIGDALAARAPEEPVTATIGDFFEQWQDPDVEFTGEDFDAIDELLPGQCTALGWSIITRIT